MLGQNDPEPAVAVGSRLRAPRTGDSYAMFYLFSMKEQQATLDLVRQALLFGGLAMVLMVGGVAWLVSRQVLEPGAAGPAHRRAVRIRQPRATDARQR